MSDPIKEAILNKHLTYGADTYDAGQRPNILAAMDEYSAPFKKALNGLIEMYKMDYPTTVHYMFRPDYLFAVEVMKGEVIENDYWKQRCLAAEEVLFHIPTKEGMRYFLVGYDEAHKKWSQLKNQTEQTSGNQISDSTQK